MNQTACSRSRAARPVPIAMHRSMVVPQGEHLRILGLWIADSSELGAPTLGTMPSMILDRLKSGFTTRSVGSETRSSGSWICLLLSIVISHVRNNDTVDNLVVGNIIPRVMTYSKSNGARISGVSSQHSFSNFWRSRTRYGVEHGNNGDNGFFLTELDV